MGFLGNILGAAVKTIATPIAVVKDIAEVSIGLEPENTKNSIESVKDDLIEALYDLGDGNL